MGRVPPAGNRRGARVELAKSALAVEAIEDAQGHTDQRDSEGHPDEDEEGHEAGVKDGHLFDPFLE